MDVCDRCYTDTYTTVVLNVITCTTGVLKRVVTRRTGCSDKWDYKYDRLTEERT